MFRRTRVGAFGLRVICCNGGNHNFTSQKAANHETLDLESLGVSVRDP